ASAAGAFRRPALPGRGSGPPEGRGASRLRPGKAGGTRTVTRPPARRAPDAACGQSASGARPERSAHPTPAERPPVAAVERAERARRRVPVERRAARTAAERTGSGAAERSAPFATERPAHAGGTTARPRPGGATAVRTSRHRRPRAERHAAPRARLHSGTGRPPERQAARLAAGTRLLRGAGCAGGGRT